MEIISALIATCLLRLPITSCASPESMVSGMMQQVLSLTQNAVSATPQRANKRGSPRDT